MLLVFHRWGNLIFMVIYFGLLVTAGVQEKMKISITPRQSSTFVFKDIDI